ncbi:MAG: HAMP domain-containing sensor histidine kinase [Gammaproteobacteria bacterium]
MRLSRPKSIVGLILLGFCLVAAPLIVSSIRSLLYVDELAERTERLVFLGVLITKESELLGEKVTAMERNARQYQVVGDPSLLKLYEEKHARFLDSTKALKAMADNDAEIGHQLWRMENRSQIIADDLEKYPPESLKLDKSLQGFADLGELAETTVSKCRDLIRTELDVLRTNSRHAQQSISWQAAALIPGTIILIVVFTALIAKPIRQTAGAIRQLGEGDLEKPITVSGSAELAKLGQALEWLRTRLAELEEAKSKFLRHVSHELKTPLASIREGTELLTDGTLGRLSRTQREVVGILRDNSLELQKQIENLLGFNARKDIADELARTRFALQSLVTDIRQQHRLTLASKALSLEANCDEIDLIADRDKIRTALDNLVSNAIKFSPEGGKIQISAVQGDSRVVIGVSDAGPGISIEDRNHIFEPFYQGKTYHNGHVRGTGLGLSVVRDCVEAHGGSVGFIEDTPGAHFRISLPMDAVS